MAVKDYPMSISSTNKILTIWGNNSDARYDYMGYSEATAFNFTHVRDYLCYLNKTVRTIAIVSGGTGYTVDDVLTVVGGTGTACTIKVLTVDGSGVILTAEIVDRGEYTVKPTNPVSVTGGSGSSATFNLTFVTYCNEVGFTFNCVLDLNYVASTPTVFIDTNKQVDFTRSLLGTATNDWTIPTINCQNYSTLRLGTLVNESSKTTKDGCQIIIRRGLSYRGGINSTSLATVQIYSCDIKATVYYKTSALISGGVPRVWNTNLQGGGFYDNATKDTSAYNCRITNCDLPIYYTQVTLDSVLIDEIKSVSRIRNRTNDVYARGLKARRYSSVVNIYPSAYNGSNATLVDCDLDVWGTRTGFPTTEGRSAYVYRQNSFNLTVLDEDGNPIEDVNVLAINSSDTTVINKDTDSNGVITETILGITTWKYSRTGGANVTTVFEYNPFKITISKAGYETIYKEVEIYDKTNWTITLKTQVPLIVTPDDVYVKKNPENVGDNRDLAV